MKELRDTLIQAHRMLVAEGLVTLTWGNVSGIDRARGLVLIKPSGVPYDRLRPEDLVTVNLEGERVEGSLKPSSDTPTHVALYRAFPDLGGICHSHSPQATAFAQAGREIPCLGTTHADHFYGPVPVTRALTREEAASAYEEHTGRVIIERLAGLDTTRIPGILCAYHGPFTWGPDPLRAVEQAVALETIARMAALTLALDPDRPPLPAHLQDTHFFRKHGPNAAYGQD